MANHSRQHLLAMFGRFLNGEDVVRGKSTYDPMRAKWGKNLDAGSQMTVANEAEPEDKNLRAAMCNMLQHNRDLETMYDYMSNASKPYHNKCVAKCRGFLRLPPAANPANAQVYISLLKFCKKHALHATDTFEFDLLGKHFDAALC